MLMSMLGKNSRSEDVPNKLDAAAKQKELGNEFFKTGDNKKALYHYNCAMMYLKGLVGLQEMETKTMNQIKVACCNNMASVNIKEERWNRCITNCNQVLELERDNTKALFRRGKAYLGNNDLERAEIDLKKASELDPNDKLIQRELQMLKKKNKDQDKKQQKFYSNLFERMSKEKDDEIKNDDTVPFKEDKDLNQLNKDEYVGMEDS